MKIGIFTFHRAHNYGAVLQCYALQEVLKAMGYEVEIVDYRQKWTEEVYKIFSLLVMNVRYKGFRSKISYLKSLHKRYAEVRRKRKFFESFNSKFLSISTLYHTDKKVDYDVCIVGSDQLWGLSCLGGQPDDVFLGNFKMKDGGKKIGYAISSNVMSIDYLHQQGQLIPSLKNFYALSFRESSIICRIRDLSGKLYPQCVDPTLLTDKKIWSPLLNDKWKNRKYIVCYRARGNGITGFSIEGTADNLAKEYGWDVVNLSNGTFGVEDFVSVIAYAQYVVTTSFHATVFSLIFQRQLSAYLLHDGHDARYEELLRKIGGEQFVYEVSEKPMLYQTIDWDKIAENLNCIRTQSLNFLCKSL